jgi:REP element-mobilizing transposase RayT
MASLPEGLRRTLENTVVDAREVAESGARAALERLAVHRPEPFPEMSPGERELRVRLRAHARQLGDRRKENGEQEIGHLVVECAYEHWHRMLFARFLEESHLLIHPDHGVPVRLDECEELAAEEGEADGWALAGRFAARMLPAIFRPDDPALHVRLAPEHQQPLEKLLASLSAEVFTADDSLGWVYQFWQTKRKKEVNESGRKIGADELPAVTQLFTEPYMVKFLLHNTLGAWWAGRVGAASSRWSSCATEADCRRLCALPGVDWEYLRFVKVEAASSRLENPRQDTASTEIGFYRKNEPVANLCGNLPHWRQEAVTYFVTFRTADSLPQEKLHQWQAEKEQWLAQHPEPRDEELTREYYQRFPERIEYWLDQGYGACQLNEPALREIVQNALCHFDGDRYDLDRFVVSGNHVHVLATPRPGYELSDILHSWKSFTANQVNRHTGRSGAFWQKESFDHIVRNPAQLERLRQYIRDHEDRGRRQDAASTWRSAAGTFEGWPHRVAELRVLDPCCGSGHFLVEAFRILVPMRMTEEGMPAREACDAVLRDNLFGLEIDERCTQIAAFNLALAAWTLPGAGGYRPLPKLNIACSGLAVGAREEEWLKLAGRDERLREGMRRLHGLFKDAPTLGSLIDPHREFEARPGELEFDKGQFEKLRPLLEHALAREEVRRDAQATETAITAQGMTEAAVLLAGTYTLVITNVPYLGYREMAPALVDYVRLRYIAEKGDLGYCLWRRLHRSVSSAGAIALVTLQHWLSLRSYTAMRRHLFNNFALGPISHLGTGAFDTISGAKVNVTLSVTQRSRDAMNTEMALLDAAPGLGLLKKAHILRAGVISKASQASQFSNPDHRISFGRLSGGAILSKHAECLAGIMNGDTPRFIRDFWEVRERDGLWAFLQSTVSDTKNVGGLHGIIFFDEGRGHLREEGHIRREKLHNADERGNSVWGREGVAISQMASLPAARYLGNKYDSNVAAIVPRRPEDLPAIWAFCSSGQFREGVRAIDRKLNVTNATFGKVPFDLSHWQKVAAVKFPHGLPEPESDDPTQWLFHGRPEASTAPLQVAVTRLLGYRWPAELDQKIRLSQRARELVRRCDELLELAEGDGIVCIPPVRGEQPSATRLQELLARAYGDEWKATTLGHLLEQAGFKGKALDVWLRDGLFEQHCQLFHRRPFIWHIWDGRRDGFAALVNYHKLDRRSLERLAYTYLGDWIEQQRRGTKAGEHGAEDRLAAALELQRKLALILEGEPPYDIFVRWKPIEEQPIGWEPDLNDGVRMNIRPFVVAGVLRKDPKITWTKDRGKEPQRPWEQYPWFWNDGRFTGDRVNDVHLTNAQKRAAREKMAAAGNRVAGGTSSGSDSRGGGS